MSRRIPVEQARTFFAHPSQQLFGLAPETIPDEGFEFWADGPVCMSFHPVHWFRVWALHIAVRPEGWGRLDSHARAVLDGFWDEHQPNRLTAWLPEENRAAIALARRIGAVVDGVMPMPDGNITMLGWQKCLKQQFP